MGGKILALLVQCATLFCTYPVTPPARLWPADLREKPRDSAQFKR